MRTGWGRVVSPEICFPENSSPEGTSDRESQGEGTGGPEEWRLEEELRKYDG